MVARHVLLNIYSAENDWGRVKRAADETLRLDSGDGPAQHAREIAQSVFDQLGTARREAERSTNPSDYLKLSVAYYQNRQFEESIGACRKALAIRPDLAEAYSNMAAAEYALGHLDNAEADLRETLRLRPNLQVAKNNLDFILWLKSQPKK
jgi:tetratricopeptide (TPR) repeat protein